MNGVKATIDDRSGPLPHGILGPEPIGKVSLAEPGCEISQTGN